MDDPTRNSNLAFNAFLCKSSVYFSPESMFCEMLQYSRMWMKNGENVVAVKDTFKKDILKHSSIFLLTTSMVKGAKKAMWLVDCSFF